MLQLDTRPFSTTHKVTSIPRAGFLSRSGSQLYENDRFLPSSIVEGNNQPKPKRTFFGRKEKAMPLLAVMADPRYNFYKALLKFERVDIYANA